MSQQQSCLPVRSVGGAVVDPVTDGGLDRRTALCGLTGVAVTGLAAAPAMAAGSVRSLLENRRDRVVVQEFDISCGAAALCTILRYQHGEDITEREVALSLIQREEYINNPDLVRIRQGFSLLDLKRFVEARGYEGSGFGQLEFENLADLEPLIVPVNFKGYNHFVVYRGHWGTQVLLADPAYGNRTMSIAHFTRGWLDYPEIGKLGFVVNRRDGLIPPNRLAPRPEDFRLVR